MEQLKTIVFPRELEADPNFLEFLQDIERGAQIRGFLWGSGLTVLFFLPEILVAFGL